MKSQLFIRSRKLTMPSEFDYPYTINPQILSERKSTLFQMKTQKTYEDEQDKIYFQTPHKRALSHKLKCLQIEINRQQGLKTNTQYYENYLQHSKNLILQNRMKRVSSVEQNKEIKKYQRSQSQLNIWVTSKYKINNKNFKFNNLKNLCQK